MAVPASIRAVERPSNTIIEDNGRDGPNRYAVRLRAGVKYVDVYKRQATVKNQYFSNDLD